jgi:hypothetical protein
VAVGVAVQAGAQVLDRVLAIVDGSPVTLSDMNAAVRLGLVETPANADERAALNALIDRRLQLIEVNRYLPPEPTGAAIEARLDETRRRFASEDAFQAALRETGVSPIDLRAAVRDNLRIESYLNQRFGAGYQPNEDEVLAYYRAHQAEFTRAGTLRPYAEARDDARKRLIASRMTTMIQDWVAGLRRRVEVTVLPK